MHTVFMLRCETGVFGRKKIGRYGLEPYQVLGVLATVRWDAKFVAAGIVVAPRFPSPLSRMTRIYSPNSFMDALRLVQLQ